MTSCDPKGAGGSMVGYPSDSLASCSIIGPIGDTGRYFCLQIIVMIFNFH